ncbi:MAG TPA: hypothetical protein VE546_10950, partial [Streptomyces sp.]|uniref:hypothetical protein n=1 Tax=Streptomyces sp. TaxID=1931 RepID=UPI002D26F179
MTQPPAPSGRPDLLGRLRSWRPWRGPAVPAWAPPALGALLGLTGGAAYGLLAAPEYTATSYVVVVPAGQADSAAALGFAQAYGRVATDSAVLAEAQASARMPADELRGSVRSVTSPDAPMVEITGIAPRPDRAAAIANAVANALTRSGNAVTGSTGVRLSLFSPAFDPTEPASPSAPLTAAVGLCAGGLVGSIALLAAPRGRREPVFPGVPAPASRSERVEPAPPPGRTPTAPAPAAVAAPAPAPAAVAAPAPAVVAAPAPAAATTATTAPAPAAVS